MRKGLLAILLSMTVMLPAAAQDSLSVKVSFPRAVGTLLFANGSIHLIDRLTDHNYSQVTMHSIRRNVQSGFVWDNDMFFINQLGHPFQGGLNFNAARNNGFSFLQSMAFTVGGALLWEYCGETEQPSINDIVTTTVAGTMFGECSHRLADHVIDDGDTGARRVLREATAFFLNPLQGLERLLTGRMWKVRRTNSLNDQTTNPLNDRASSCTVTFSDRYVVAADGASHGHHHSFIAISAEYGETADGESHCNLYDFIAVDGAFAFGGDQPVIPRLNVTARILSTPLTSHHSPLTTELGLYQFYRYDDTRLSDSLRGPFPFGETASFGPGIIMKSASPRLAFEERLFVRGVILGSAESDYYHCYERQYNMGSGYGASSLTRLTWSDAINFQFDAYYLHLYTWRGYEPRTVADVEADGNPNVLGDRSHARMLKLDVQLQARLTPHCGLALGAAWFSRNTHYKYHPNNHADSYELRAGLMWKL